MSSNKIKVVRGDTRPRLLVTFIDANSPDPDNPDPINITGAALALKFRRAGTLEVLDTLAGVVTDGPAGQGYFDWNPTTLDVASGEYEGELSATFADTTKQTVYDIQKFTVREHF